MTSKINILPSETDTEYAQLLSNISELWTRAKDNAALSVSRSNLTYMRKLYLAFPKCETLSHKLTWSHYFELLKCDNPLEFQFYYKEAIKEGWKVRDLKRQINPSITVNFFFFNGRKLAVIFLYNPPQTSLPSLKKNKKKLHSTLNQH